VGLDATGQTAIWTPGQPLALLSPYTATLTTDIESLAASTLDANYSWSFRTRDGQWGEAGLIEISSAGDASVPQVAVDSSGNAIAVWQQSDGTRDNTWANRFTPATGWGAAEPIETEDTRASQPQVAVDPSGNAIAVWRQSDTTRFNISANHFTPATGWGAAEPIDTNDADGSSSPQVAVDPSGNAIAVWHQWDAARRDIWANRFTPATGWSVAERIETDGANDAAGPHVAVDSSGNAIAVWQQSDGTRSNIWANRFTPATGWSVAETIEADDGNATGPQVVVDPSGNAIAVWTQSDGARFNIWANRFTPLAGWGAAELIEADDGNATGPQVVVDPSGNAIAIWTQSDGTRFNIWANRFTPLAGWGAAELIETDDGTVSSLGIAIDPSGNAIAVWTQADGTRFNIWANRFTPTTGWGAAELIESDDAGGARSPQVAVDPSGNAITVWEQSDGTRDNIWAKRFD
jgi:predicted enzyme related to lactoylglutathione lyase